MSEVSVDPVDVEMVQEPVIGAEASRQELSYEPGTDIISLDDNRFSFFTSTIQDGGGQHAWVTDQEVLE